jgi:hypothetical protein
MQLKDFCKILVSRGNFVVIVAIKASVKAGLELK